MLLIDSTIYVDWFRRRIEPREIIEPWVRARALAVCGAIRMEVIRRVINPRQKARVGELFDALEEITTDSALWDAAAELAWTLDRKGIVLPLTDLVIAACACRSSATLVTTDFHFSKIPELNTLQDVLRFK